MAKKREALEPISVPPINTVRSKDTGKKKVRRKSQFLN